MKRTERESAWVGAGVGAGLGLFYVAVSHYAEASCRAMHTTAAGTEAYAEDACAKKHPVDHAIANHPVALVLTAAALGALVSAYGRR